MRVSTGPGHTAFTRIPWCATSPAAVLVSPITACFDATYAGMPGVATKPATEAVLTTAPLPWRIISGNTWRRPRKTPFTFTPITASNMASSYSEVGASLPSGAVTVHHHHLRAMTRERHGCGAADSIAAAGDHRNLADEIHHVGLRLMTTQPITGIHGCGNGRLTLTKGGTLSVGMPA